MGDRLKRHLRDLYGSDQAVKRPEDFVGRKSEILELLDSIQASNCVQIVAPRRMGKSSVLVHLTRESTLRQRISNLGPLLHVYLNLQALPDPTEEAFWGQLLWSIRTRLIERGAEDHTPLKDHPALPMDKTGIDKWCKSAPSETGAHFPYSEAYDRLQSLKELGFSRMTILMDELEILGQIPTQRDLTQRLRAMAGDSRWGVTFVTASRQPIANLTQDGTLSASPFYNIFSQTLRLGPFSRSELDTLLTLPERLADQGLLEGWDPAVSLTQPPHARFIKSVAGYHPFYSTVACRRLLRRLSLHLQEGRPTPLSGEDLALIEADLSDDLSGQIDDAIADRNEEERLFLNLVAAGQSLGDKDPSYPRLKAEGIIRVNSRGELKISSRLVAAKLGPPPTPPSFFRRYQRLLGVLGLVGAMFGAIYVGNDLLGPLPRQPSQAPIELSRGPLAEGATDIRVSLVYPPEVRVEEETSIDVILEAPPGPAGMLHVSLRLREGAATFLDGEVQHSFELPANVPVSQLWTLPLIPHPSPERRYDLSLQATWSPVVGSTGQTLVSDAIVIDGRPLAGAKVVLTSAGAIVLGILGFFGLNLHTALSFFWGLIRGSGRGEKDKDS